MKNTLNRNAKVVRNCYRNIDIEIMIVNETDEIIN